MKKYLLFIFTLVIGAMTHQISAQDIDIPDINFKNALIADGVDKNGDGKIQESEALEVKYLYILDKKISDLKGIEYFKNLIKLDCSENQLTNLNLSNLIKLSELRCNNNQLTNLELSDLSELQELYCHENQLSSLDLANTTKLNILYCSINKLTSLDINHLINLIDVQCMKNQLSMLNVHSLKNLKQLSFGYNQISNIDISNLSKLTYLECTWNLLTDIQVNHLSKLEWLYTSGNPNTILDVSKLDNLVSLYCSDSPLLETVILKNWIDSTSWFMNGISLFNSVPNLKLVCTENDLEKIKQKALENNYTNVIIGSFCSSTSGGVFYSLDGQVTLDNDNNGCDDSSPSFPNLKIKISHNNESGYIISGSNGNFSLYADAGTYTFQPVLDHPDYFTVSPTSTTYTLPDTISPSFCITPKGDFNDLAVNIIPVRAARPGFSDATYKIVYKNQGTTTQSGTVTFNFDDNKMNVISSSPAADQSDFGLLTFNFSNLAPFESKSALVTMRTNAPTDNPAVNVNDVLNFSANISAQTDDNTDDNTAILYQTVIGSYDPNDKTCLEGDIITPAMVGKRVNYLIRFENTGTAPAENVVVTDYIDTTVFDVNSLLVTDASHLCHTQISKGNKVQFIFNDIQLPFTEPDKHGFVAFSILLKDYLQIGDSIKNQADIYFDYNLPITTNEAVSEIKNRVITTVRQRISDIQLSVYPNPSKGNFSIGLKSNKTAPVQISVVDIEGKIVFAKQYTAQQHLIPIQLDKLPKGTYLVQAQSENDMVSRKIVIQ